MEPGSKAERLVLSFPATGENYSKAIQQLKERFGRDDLLVQVYVRDLLRLVMKNSAAGRGKADLPSLYDELEGKLRALETLGRTKEKYGDFLTPLVESCLPEEVLVTWERSRNHDLTEDKNCRTLEQLMNFLRQEVNGEEMVRLARTGFGTNSNLRKREPTTEKESDLATAAALVSTEKKELKCNGCGEPHFCVMCPKLEDKSCESKDVVSKSENSLSNFDKTQTVFLQTLCVRIKCNNREKIIRALADSGSQSSYVSQKVLSELKATPLREETVIHSLFGGRETNPKRHKIFTVEVRGLKGSFACSFEALSERKICSFIPKVSNPYILNELKKKNIEVSDSLCKMKEIDLLIGADVLGKLLTGRSVDLESGLTAVEMKLGWTVMGKQNTNEKDDVFRTLSMHAKNIPLNELGELESIGITDPTCNVNKKACIGEHLAEFEDKLKILPCGRYEVELPWKYDFSNLPDNKDLAWKGNEKIIKSKCSNLLENYQNVFKEWENLNIIERVPDSELENKCHYLPHRPVIKIDSKTTKVRPVFDASASQRGKPSLNECLFKGMNLIELIPDIDRLRLHPIGLSVSIEKAYSLPEYEIAQKLESSFFVDNCVTGVHNTEEEAKFIEQSQLIMSKGCFNLRGFESNVASENVTKHSGEASILGILWNLDNDTLRCNINIEALTCETKITKRLILSTVQEIFDPIGLLSPTTLLPKLILQDASKLKHSWDLELPPDIVNKFLKCFKEIALSNNVTLPCYIIINSTTEQYVFVDASKEAYVACVYDRSVVEIEVEIYLVRSKTRVDPLKSLSIPRVELIACCIGARLLQEKWKLTQPELWKHIFGTMNIADVLSREFSPKQFFDFKRWELPTWLKLAPEKWLLSEVDWGPEVDAKRKILAITTIDLNLDAPLLPPKLVRIVNELLKRTPGKSVLNYEELNALICDCELVINSRPLTYVSENPQELIPLTLAMFLIENCSSDVTDIGHVDLQSLKKRKRYRYKLFNDLRQRFRKEYLGQFIQKHNERPTREPRFAEIVSIGDDNKKRVFSPLAKIIKLIPGRDKRVRAVRLKTQNGIFVRPVERVYSLEIRAADDEAVAIADKGMSEMESNPEEFVQKTSVVKKCYPDIVLEKYTRSGKCVKVPKTLDRLNNECHMFETLPRVSKGGGMLETEVKRGPIE
ncbi:uncharacterized protein LOC129223142 [Uloborus diversus]|uniref:uncharacterized protein LOC129223142 n=1 Tax=Uloborus diversus TaxID=327109 RepID=UPI00240A513B|nr:uncharacterized protein LOC129223142 [Uloborus diversus]